VLDKFQLGFQSLIKTIRRPLGRLRRYSRHKTGYILSMVPLTGQVKPTNQPRVLVVGVYVSSVKHFGVGLCKEFAAAKECRVEQRWASLGKKSTEPSLAAVTAIECLERVPKFELLNRLMSAVDLTQFDYVVCTDDDVSIQPGFLDVYIALQQRFNFSISQPARTWASFLDHPIVRRNPKLLARETRFVEIGPIFSFDKAMTKALIPFDLETPMGWGYDFVWPVQVAKLGLKMGIIDATPVDHTVRPRGAIYSTSLAAQQSDAYKEKHGALPAEQAFVELEKFSR
jgi:hypothetical protein